MAGEREKPTCPEIFDTKLHPVFVFNIESRRFKQVTAQAGVLMLPKFHELFPSEEKTLLIEVKNKQGRYSYYKPLGPENTLLKRVMESCFSCQKPWLNHEEVIFVTPFNSQGLTDNYQIISAKTLLEKHEELMEKTMKEIKEREKIIQEGLRQAYIDEEEQQISQSTLKGKRKN